MPLGLLSSLVEGQCKKEGKQKEGKADSGVDSVTVSRSRKTVSSGANEAPPTQSSQSSPPSTPPRRSVLETLRRMTIGGSSSPAATADRHPSDISNFKKLYRLGPELGRGGFGTVYSAFRNDGLVVAVKFISRRNVTEWGYYEERLVPLELIFLMRCQAIEGVIRVLNWYERSDGYLIVMERPVGSSDLFDFVSESGPLDEAVARKIFKQILECLTEVQSLGIWHRDIKDENILIDKATGAIRLLDFGSGAYVKEDKYTDFEGTRVYSPPEWIEECAYDGEEATVWSLGILLYDMVQGDIPFKRDSDIVSGFIHWRAPISPACKSLVRACLARRGCNRPRLSAIYSHEWMAASSSTESPSPSLSPSRHKLSSVPERLVTSSVPRRIPRVPVQPSAPRPIPVPGDHHRVFEGDENERPPSPEGPPTSRSWPRLLSSPSRFKRGKGSDPSGASSGFSSGYGTGSATSPPTSSSNGALMLGSY